MLQQPPPYIVGIYELKPFAYKDHDGNYTGLYIDIWNLIKKQVIIDFRNKWGQNVPESDIYTIKYLKSMMYDDGIDHVEEGKYDIILADFDITTNRCKKISYTTPFMVGKDVIIYKPSEKGETKIYKMFKSLSPTILSLFLLSFFLGTLFYFMNIKENISMKTSIFAMFSALLGSFTSIYYETKTNNRLFLIITGLLVVSTFVFSLVFRSQIIIKLIPKLVVEGDPHRFSLEDKNILVRYKTSSVNLLTSLGSNPVAHKLTTTSVDNLVQHYLNIKDDQNISGVYLTYMEAKDWLLQNKDFKISPLDYLDVKYMSYAVNKNKKELLDSINNGIHNIFSKHKLDILCKEYTGSSCFNTSISCQEK
jgi:ABC-type amino acid transport substrate-binding protein